MTSSNAVLVTGATGFVGRALLDRLGSDPSIVISAQVRCEGADLPEGVAPVLFADNYGPSAGSPLDHVDCVVHLAGRAHVLRETLADPLAEFREVNVTGTLNLARQAMAAGVKRFIFISSIGVNGSYTSGESFTESSVPAPHADYALSKLEAEQGLLKLVEGSCMELVIIRPPLVYAGHAPGNFQRLMKLVATGFPLPFSSVTNQRSMIALGNLVDFIALCIEHPAAANELFLVSDGVEVSMPEMVRYLAEGMGRKVFLYPVHRAFMCWGANFFGKQALYNQLFSSLIIDSSKARTILGWTPPLTPAQALCESGSKFKLIKLT